MVVDDDADIRELIADVARDEGYAVSLAGDLRQAGIAIARHTHGYAVARWRRHEFLEGT